MERQKVGEFEPFERELSRPQDVVLMPTGKQKHTGILMKIKLKNGNSNPPEFESPIRFNFLAEP